MTFWELRNKHLRSRRCWGRWRTEKFYVDLLRLSTCSIFKSFWIFMTLATFMTLSPPTISTLSSLLLSATERMLNVWEVECYVSWDQTIPVQHRPNLWTRRLHPSVSLEDTHTPTLTDCTDGTVHRSFCVIHQQTRFLISTEDSHLSLNRDIFSALLFCLPCSCPSNTVAQWWMFPLCSCDSLISALVSFWCNENKRSENWRTFD